MRLDIIPLLPFVKFSAIKVQNPRFSAKEVANIIIITRIDPNSQVSLIHGLYNERDSCCGTSLIISLSTTGPAIGIWGSRMNSCLNIQTMKIVCCITIQNTIRKRVGNVSSLTMSLCSERIDVFMSGDGPLMT